MGGDGALWAVSSESWLCPVGSVPRVMSCRLHLMGHVLWIMDCFQWAVSCGPCPVGCSPWTVSCGPYPMGHVLWACPVGHARWVVLYVACPRAATVQVCGPPTLHRLPPQQWDQVLRVPLLALVLLVPSACCLASAAAGTPSPAPWPLWMAPWREEDLRIRRCLSRACLMPGSGISPDVSVLGHVPRPLGMEASRGAVSVARGRSGAWPWLAVCAGLCGASVLCPA